MKKNNLNKGNFDGYWTCRETLGVIIEGLTKYKLDEIIISVYAFYNRRNCLHTIMLRANEIVKTPSKYCMKKTVSCLCTSSPGHDSGFNSFPSLVLICIVSVSGSVL
jgi:hypothetical protein